MKAITIQAFLFANYDSRPGFQRALGSMVELRFKCVRAGRSNPSKKLKNILRLAKATQ